MSQEVLQLYCRDSCGRSIPHNEIDLHGWTRLPLFAKVRCKECTRQLEAVNGPQRNDDEAESV